MIQVLKKLYLGLMAIVLIQGVLALASGDLGYERGTLTHTWAMFHPFIDGHVRFGADPCLLFAAA